MTVTNTQIIVYRADERLTPAPINRLPFVDKAYSKYPSLRWQVSVTSRERAALIRASKSRQVSTSLVGLVMSTSSVMPKA